MSPKHALCRLSWLATFIILLTCSAPAVLCAAEPKLDAAVDSRWPIYGVPQPGGWALMADQQTLIVSVPEKAQLLYFDSLTGTPTKVVELDFKPGSLALQGDTLFASLSGGSNVYVLDAKTGRQLKEISVGSDALAHLACHPKQGLVYASTTKFDVYSLTKEGVVTKTKGKGFHLAVDPVKGDTLITAIQPQTDQILYISEDANGTIRVLLDEWGARGVVLKFSIDGKNLKFVDAQDNATVNGWTMHLSPDGKRVCFAGGGGWRPKAGGATGGGYVTAIYDTAKLTSMLGQAPHGLGTIFHPDLPIGVTNHYGWKMTIFNSKSLVEKGKVDISKHQYHTPSLLAFVGKGTRLALWSGNNVKEQQGLHFIPLTLTDEDKAVLTKAYGRFTFPEPASEILPEATNPRRPVGAGRDNRKLVSAVDLKRDVAEGAHWSQPDGLLFADATAARHSLFVPRSPKGDYELRARFTKSIGGVFEVQLRHGERNVGQVSFGDKLEAFEPDGKKPLTKTQVAYRPINDGKSHLLRASVKGGRIIIYLDGSKLIDHPLNAQAATKSDKATSLGIHMGTLKIEDMEVVE